MNKPLWSFPWNLPAVEGKAIYLVQVMEDQAAAIASTSPLHDEAQFELLRAYALDGRLADAIGVMERLLARDVPADGKARAAMVVAGSAERCGDFVTAVRLYRQVLAFEQEGTGVSYYGHNNLAYSLNQLGSYEEAEPHARAAIAMIPSQYNAHKNLGVALEGLGRFADAVRAYLEAIYAWPFDRRAFQHLETLVGRHPELLEQMDGLAEEIDRCRTPSLRLMEGPNPAL